MIDRKIVDEYLKLVELHNLDLKKYELVDIIPTDKQKFVDIENSTIDVANDTEKYQDLVGLSITELENIIEELKMKEYYTNSNNGLKFYTIKRLEAEKILDKLHLENPK